MMYSIQYYSAKRRRYVQIAKRHYYGDAIDLARARVKSDHDDCRVRTYDPRTGKHGTVWEWDPSLSAHPTERPDSWNW